jgi:LAO/AO transport system kinase
VTRVGDAKGLAGALIAGSRRALARGITLVESTRPEHRAEAERLLAAVAPRTGAGLRVGVSGAPGVGKSTLIESLGLTILAAGRRLAVLAVDPSSSLSGGSILGDKTRMPELARHADAFVRPSPSGTTLGGVARRTRESIALCEAAGYDVVLVETVGVGQSEVAVAGMTDLFVLLLSPGGGDDLQGIKRGIMELTDVALITKADGDLAEAAGRAAADCANALRLLRRRSARWTPTVRTCSAREGRGIDAVWALMLDFERVMRASGELEQRRAGQAEAWLWSEVSEQLMAALRGDPGVRVTLPELQARVRAGELPAAAAADRLVARFLGRDDGRGCVPAQDHLSTKER